MNKQALIIGVLAGFLVGIFVGLFVPKFWRDADFVNEKSLYGMEDKPAEAEIIRLYDVEHKNLENMDIAGQERFLPEDFVVTNPFNMFIRKPQVIERLKTDIIKYSKYERTYDYFRRYGNTMIVVGAELVIPTPDANRPDAGKTVRRRFTEIWIFRDGGWQKVARHASNIPES